jgi:mono/diheme cytochrome c family protein
LRIVTMRAVRAIALGIGAAGVALVMSLSATAATTQDPPAKPAAGKVDAAEIYKTRCQVCHAADGNSPMPNMSFADGVWRHGSTIKEVTNTITNGVPATAMMPFKTQLSPAEITAMARFVRKFDKKLK